MGDPQLDSTVLWLLWLVAGPGLIFWLLLWAVATWMNTGRTWICTMIFIAGTLLCDMWMWFGQAHNFVLWDWERGWRPTAGAVESVLIPLACAATFLCALTWFGRAVFRGKSGALHAHPRTALTHTQTARMGGA